MSACAHWSNIYFTTRKTTSWIWKGTLNVRLRGLVIVVALKELVMSWGTSGHFLPLKQGDRLSTRLPKGVRWQPQSCYQILRPKAFYWLLEVICITSPQNRRSIRLCITHTEAESGLAKVALTAFSPELVDLPLLILGHVWFLLTGMTRAKLGDVILLVSPLNIPPPLE